MQEKSEREHHSMEKELLERLKKMGYQERHLYELQKFMDEKCPVIIHFHLHKHMNFYLKDTYYRNQF